MKMMGRLLSLCVSLSELQSAWPEAMNGEYSRALQWARNVVAAGRDSAGSVLDDYAKGYKENEWPKLAEELNKAKYELGNTGRELGIVKKSFGYYFMRFCAEKIDKLFPEGTRRAELRKILAASYQILRYEGIRSFLRQAWKKIKKRELRIIELDEQYQIWLKNNELTDEGTTKMQEGIARFRYKPKISIVMPVYDPEEKWLRLAIDSVIDQIYPEWELCVADDASTKKSIRKILEEYSAKDARIKVKYLAKNRGISGASNEALEMACGEFIGFLDHDDELMRDALFEVVKLLNQSPSLDLIYSDEDKKDLKGRRVEPFFKPDWSPDLLLSYNYVPHFTVYRRSKLTEIGGFRLGYDGSQDYDLTLRFTERTTRIGHIPKVLYSWRKAIGSAARSLDAKPYAYQAAMKALREAVARRGMEGEVYEIGVRGRYRVKYRVKGKPLVSILIPTRNPSLILRCLESMRLKTTYDNYEVLVINISGEDEVDVQAKKHRKCRIVRYDFPESFNFSKINNLAAKEAKGEYLIFLNDDTEVIEPEWIEAMLEHAQRPEVGAVGAKLLHPDGTVQHAGIILGLRGPAGHYSGIRDGDAGYFELASVARNCSAVTAACMMVRKMLFIEQGAFDERLGQSWQDVDFCLRIRESGFWIVYTPFARLYHMHGRTRETGNKSPDEHVARELFKRRWESFIEKGDPYYNPNLSLERPYALNVQIPRSDKLHGFFN